MISDIRLQHFRSYSDETFEFTPAVNIIVGANGSGKTNLLEAILVTARGSSYRAKDSELIQYDEPWARIDAHVDSPAGLSYSSRDTADSSLRTLKIVQEATANKASKSYEIGGQSYRRLMPGKALPVVIFEPNHLAMLTGSPELRRGYLDDLLEQINPGYSRIRRDFKRVLAQRNTLLKRLGSAAASQIFPWNIRLSELGGSITQARLALLANLNQHASQLYSSLAHSSNTVELRYETSLSLESYGSALLRALEASFERDVLRGFTGAGPHREDICVLINDRPAQISASRGEARTAVLMLKVMELRFIEQARAVRPMLLLDDVFSELDGARRQALTSYLQDYQTFISTTDVDVVMGHFMETSTIIPIGSALP